MLHMFRTHVASVYPKYFICFKCMLHSSVLCFMLQVQITGVGVHEGGQGQAAATDAWRRRIPLPSVWGGGTGRAVLLWKWRG
jgi:hypothetical protein